jgi:hypothetical protein
MFFLRFGNKNSERKGSFRKRLQGRIKELSYEVWTSNPVYPICLVVPNEAIDL